MNALVFFFAALTEDQVAVLSVSNLPWQGFPATCLIDHCCVCSPLLFASEILCDLPGDSPTYGKQRMNKIGPVGGRVSWKPKMLDDGILGFVYGFLLGNCGYQTDRKKDLRPKRNRTMLVILA